MTYAHWTPPAKVVTVKDHYGCVDPAIEEGYRATGEFRPVTKGEHYLDQYLEADVWSSNIPSTRPWIILVPTPKRVTFTFVGHRSARQGDWFTGDLKPVSMYQLWTRLTTSAVQYDIYIRSEE